jgi:hypothetical protein
VESGLFVGNALSFFKHRKKDFKSLIAWLSKNDFFRFERRRIEARLENETSRFRSLFEEFVAYPSSPFDDAVSLPTIYRMANEPRFLAFLLETRNGWVETLESLPDARFRDMIESPFRDRHIPVPENIFPPGASVRTVLENVANREQAIQDAVLRNFPLSDKKRRKKSGDTYRALLRNLNLHFLVSRFPNMHEAQIDRLTQIVLGTGGTVAVNPKNLSSLYDLFSRTALVEENNHFLDNLYTHVQLDLPLANVFEPMRDLAPADYMDFLEDEGVFDGWSPAKLREHLQNLSQSIGQNFTHDSRKIDRARLYRLRSAMQDKLTERLLEDFVERKRSVDRRLLEMEERSRILLAPAWDELANETLDLIADAEFLEFLTRGDLVEHPGFDLTSPLEDGAPYVRFADLLREIADRHEYLVERAREASKTDALPFKPSPVYEILVPSCERPDRVGVLVESVLNQLKQFHYGKYSDTPKVRLRIYEDSSELRFDRSESRYTEAYRQKIREVAERYADSVRIDARGVDLERPRTDESPSPLPRIEIDFITGERQKNMLLEIERKLAKHYGDPQKAGNAMARFLGGLRKAPSDLRFDSTRPFDPLKRMEYYLNALVDRFGWNDAPVTGLLARVRDAERPTDLSKADLSNFKRYLEEKADPAALLSFQGILYFAGLEKTPPAWAFSELLPPSGDERADRKTWNGLRDLHALYAEFDRLGSMLASRPRENRSELRGARRRMNRIKSKLLEITPLHQELSNRVRNAANLSSVQKDLLLAGLNLNSWGRKSIAGIHNMMDYHLMWNYRPSRENEETLYLQVDDDESLSSMRVAENPGYFETGDTSIFHRNLKELRPHLDPESANAVPIVYGGNILGDSTKPSYNILISAFESHIHFLKNSLTPGQWAPDRLDVLESVEKSRDSVPNDALVGLERFKTFGMQDTDVRTPMQINGRFSPTDRLRLNSLGERVAFVHAALRSLPSGHDMFRPRTYTESTMDRLEGEAFLPLGGNRMLNREALLTSFLVSHVGSKRVDSNKSLLMKACGTQFWRGLSPIMHYRGEYRIGVEEEADYYQLRGELHASLVGGAIQRNFQSMPNLMAAYVYQDLKSFGEFTGDDFLLFVFEKVFQDPQMLTPFEKKVWKTLLLQKRREGPLPPGQKTALDALVEVEVDERLESLQKRDGNGKSTFRNLMEIEFGENLQKVLEREVRYGGLLKERVRSYRSLVGLYRRRLDAIDLPAEEKTAIRENLRSIDDILQTADELADYMTRDLPNDIDLHRNTHLRQIFEDLESFGVRREIMNLNAFARYANRELEQSQIERFRKIGFDIAA